MNLVFFHLMLTQFLSQTLVFRGGKWWWRRSRQWWNGPYLRLEKSCSTFWGSPLSINILSWKRLISSTVVFCLSPEADKAFLHFLISLSDSHRQERNNDMDNQRLSAIKIVLEEWRHWLERTKHPVRSKESTVAYIQTYCRHCSAILWRCTARYPWIRYRTPKCSFRALIWTGDSFRRGPYLCPLCTLHITPKGIKCLRRGDEMNLSPSWMLSLSPSLHWGLLGCQATFPDVPLLSSAGESKIQFERLYLQHISW